MSTVTVHDFAGESEQVFTCSPREAVIAAHAQSLGDFSTWDYETKYGAKVFESDTTVGCGDFVSRKPTLRIDLDTFAGVTRKRVHDVPSGVGGTFEAEVIEDRGENVLVEVRYGSATPQGWVPWQDWDGYRMVVDKKDLGPEKELALYRDVEFYRSGEPAAPALKP